MYQGPIIDTHHHLFELKDHPWFLATQFHPEFQSRPTAPHPIFREFIKATLEAPKR